MLTAVAPTIVTVRAAEVSDVPGLVEMGRRFRRETVYATRLRENPTKMGDTATTLITSDDGLVLVLDYGGELVGVIGMVLYDHHLSGERTAGEVFFWVDPEHRGKGLRLMRQAERWARERAATTVQMIAPTPEVGRLYDRLGYAELETSYGKELT